MKIDKIILKNNGNITYIINDTLLCLSREVNKFGVYTYKAEFERFGTIFIPEESFEQLEKLVNENDK